MNKEKLKDILWNIGVFALHMIICCGIIIIAGIIANNFAKMEYQNLCLLIGFDVSMVAETWLRCFGPQPW